jgi:hypothetical protein
VSERGSASSENLDEGVGVFDFVRVLSGVAVDSFHSVTFGGTGNTRLSGVDIVVKTVESTDSDHGRDSLGENSHVVSLVNSTGAHGVGVKSSHSPSERTLLLPELAVELFSVSGHSLLVGKFRFGKRGVESRRGGSGRTGVRLFLAVLVVLVLRTRLGHGGRKFFKVLLGLVLVILLYDGIVGYKSLFALLDSGSEEESGTHDEHPPLDAVVSLDDLGVNVGDEEESR